MPRCRHWLLGFAWRLLRLPPGAWLAVFISLLSALPVAAQERVIVELQGVNAEIKTNVMAYLDIYQDTRPAGFSLFGTERSKAKHDQRSTAADADKEQADSVAQDSQRQFTPQRMQRLHQLAESQILNAVQPFGYYSARVAGELLQIKEQTWRANYRIDLGQRTQVVAVDASVEGAGAELPSVRSRLQAVRALAGTELNHATYTAQKSALLTDLYNGGYLDARYESAKLKVDIANHRADIDWQLVSGERYFFGPISIEQDVLRPSLVARYHNIEAGQPFATERLIDLQVKLNDTNYFNNVVLDIQRDDMRGQNIPVQIRAEARKPRRYTAGVGYGTDTGPRISAGIEARRVNDRGHRYRIDTRVSAIASEVQAEYSVPIKNVATDRWQLYAAAEQSEVGDADTTAYLVGVAQEDDWGPFRRRMYLNVEQENFEFDGESRRESTLVYPGLNLSFNRVDNPRFVQRGYSLSATVQGGLKSLGSKVDFFTTQFNARGVLGFAQRYRLLTSLELGYVDTDEFSALPPSKRFFAGGDRSVRGYAFESISPVNANDDNIGGRYLAAASVELDYQLTGPWRLAAFVDAGEASDVRPQDFKLGVGLGLRYRSPVGMIRLDLAHPLDDPDTAVRLHVSIGPDL